jgi:hypothetical protein
MSHAAADQSSHQLVIANSAVYADVLVASSAQCGVRKSSYRELCGVCLSQKVALCFKGVMPHFFYLCVKARKWPCVLKALTLSLISFICVLMPEIGFVVLEALCLVIYWLIIIIF